ncbi:hypothetical protein DXG01_006326 [Tephrocybe rancida]|nr:hypothetical protein DXG01_006326 [Tephrocybe rancida]
MSAFSRVQLAAALLEYDNDLENPDAPNRSAQESAIFLPFRQTALNRTRKNDYLGVPLAGDGGAAGKSIKSNSALGHQSRASISTLHNPFGRDDHEDEHDHEGELEVDLTSWGLDAFIPKEKASKTGKGKEKLTDSLPLHSVLSVPTHQPMTSHDSAVTGPRRALGASRSMSVGGNLEYFGTEGERSSFNKMNDDRRRSFTSAMEATGMESHQITQRRRASSYSFLATQGTFQQQTVPFPTTSARSGSLDLNEDGSFRPSSLGSRLEPLSVHERTRSTASADSGLILNDVVDDPDSRQRTMSNATMATILPADDNPFVLRPPSRSSRFDPKAAVHARTVSNASMGSRMMLDQDGMSVHTFQASDGRERRYSTTLDLLRPKVLVMPSPLQPTTVAPPSPNDKIRDGFQLSTDGPPLPPGARSSRRASATFSMETPPLASNSFTPNPLTALSLSQMTFRNTLKIDGQRDPYVDTSLPRATMDGEQAQFEPEVEDIPTVAVTDVDEPAPKTGRPAGKLFGKSLIDDLESRKAQMRSKQRVFTGDERPSMMARASNQRANTLIDPAALQARPVSQNLNSFGSPGPQPGLARRNSANIKPLLTFDEEDKAAGKLPGARLPHGRSVFGVDTLWEKEMLKLKEIEAREQHEEEERKLRDAAEELRKSKKTSKRKHRSKPNLTAEPEGLSSPMAAESRVSIEPPVLPDIPRAIRKPPPQIPDASDSDDSDVGAPRTQKVQVPDSNWHADSSDEEDGGPRRTTGTGPRFPSKHHHRTSDDADDVPLSSVRSLKANLLSPDSDDERPLSSLLQKKQSSLLNINFDNLRRADEDDDNQPLGLRVSRLTPSLRANSQAGDDDDRPLAFHPEQQRRSQFQLMAAQQQQQQQQQFMMQAQMQNSMYFSPPSMMGSPFFGPTMMPMMVQAPMPIPSPPPLHDQAKFNRVDSWRHDVAVEGES